MEASISGRSDVAYNVELHTDQYVSGQPRDQTCKIRSSVSLGTSSEGPLRYTFPAMANAAKPERTTKREKRIVIQVVVRETQRS